MCVCVCVCVSTGAMATGWDTISLRRQLPLPLGPPIPERQAAFRCQWLPNHEGPTCGWIASHRPEDYPMGLTVHMHTPPT